MELSKKKLLALICILTIATIIAGLTHLETQDTGKDKLQENITENKSWTLLTFTADAYDSPENYIDNIHIVYPYPWFPENTETENTHWLLYAAKTTPPPYGSAYIEMVNGQENVLIGNRTSPVDFTVRKTHFGEFGIPALDVKIDRLYGRDNEENIIGERIYLRVLFTVNENVPLEALQFAETENERYIMYTSSSAEGQSFGSYLIKSDENFRRIDRPIDSIGVSDSQLENGSGWYSGIQVQEQEPPYNKYTEWSYMDPQPSKPVEYWSNDHE